MWTPSIVHYCSTPSGVSDSSPFPHRLRSGSVHPRLRSKRSGGLRAMRGRAFDGSGLGCFWFRLVSFETEAFVLLRPAVQVQFELVMIVHFIMAFLSIMLCAPDSRCCHLSLAFALPACRRAAVGTGRWQ